MPWVDVAHPRLTEVLTADESHGFDFHVNLTHSAVNPPLTAIDGDEASIEQSPTPHHV